MLLADCLWKFTTKTHLIQSIIVQMGTFLYTVGIIQTREVV